MHIWGAAALAMGLLACESTEESTGDGGVVQVVETPDMGSADPLRAFCEQQAQAKCGWAVDCLTPGQMRAVFGLDGASAEACAAADTEVCYGDVSDRETRGTLDFQPNAVGSCTTKLADAPCLDTDPSDWVGDWYKRVAATCNSVVRGNVPLAGACATRRDCQNGDHLCVDGACREAEPADIMQACGDEIRSSGSFTPDASCPGELCVGRGANAQDLFGTCTADCRFGTGCPSGAYCLQQQAPGAPPAWYCTWPCARDTDCQGGLVCTPINADDPDTQHCGVTAPE
jgi:hypothetical protein